MSEYLNNKSKKEWSAFEEIMRSWRGDHPYNKGEKIGFWTVRSWYDIEDSAAKKDYSLLQKKRYAYIKISAWFNDVDMGVLTKEIVEEQENKDFYELEILIHGENRIRAPKDQKELYEADLIQVADGVRRSFKTEGFERSAVTSIVEGIAISVKENFLFILPKTIEASLKTAWEWVKQKKKGGEDVSLLETFTEKAAFHPEMFPQVKRFFIDIALKKSTVILAMVAHLLPFVEIEGNLGKLVASFFGWNVGWLGGMGVAFVVGFLISKLIVDPLVKKYFTPQVAANIFAGFDTPEGIEKEYNEKLEYILDNKDISWKEMKEQVLDLHREFQLEVRPEIEKGLYLSFSQAEQRNTPFRESIRSLLEKGTDSIKSFFSKKASQDMPLSMKLLRAESLVNIQCEIEDKIKSGELTNLIYEAFGKEHKFNGDEIREFAVQNKELVSQIQKQLEPHLPSET